MSDTPTGASSSEFKLSVAVAIFGAILSGVTVTLGQLQESFPSVGWIGVLAGALTTVASVLGYAKSRATVKAAQATADAISKSALVKATYAVPLGEKAPSPLP